MKKIITVVALAAVAVAAFLAWCVLETVEQINEMDAYVDETDFAGA